MSFDITNARARDTATIPLKNGDGTPLVDSEGAKITVTLSGPGTKVWKQAEAERNRKRRTRAREENDIMAAMDDAEEDQIAFLASVTAKFSDNLSHPDAKTKGDLPKAIYSDDGLGFIRDQAWEEARSWTAFTKGSAKD